MAEADKTSPVLEKRSFADDDASDSERSPVAGAHPANARAMTKLWAKMDLFVLPVVTLLYFLSSLVRPVLPIPLCLTHTPRCFSGSALTARAGVCTDWHV